jgi:hypothetical protein
MTRKQKRFRSIVGISILSILVALVGATLAFTITSDDLNPTGAGSDPYLIVNGATAPAYPKRVEYGVQSGVDNAGWTVINLAYSYASPVVIATPSYTASEPSLATRIRNASATSFEVRVDRTDGSAVTISGVNVHWLVVDAGTYTVAADGIKMEAATVTSTVTDIKGSWVGEAQTYVNTYTAPVVLGQVMTYNDVDWSSFWASATDPKAPPDASVIRVGKHVGEDPDTARSNETVGYVVIEAGTGTFPRTEYETAVGLQEIKGWEDAPPYTYTHGVASATTVILSSAGMENTDGNWPVLIEPSPVTGTDFDLVMQEDQEADAEVKTGEITEEIAYIVFE